ncbi:MAG: hypothetical protein DHS20C02_18520 [Micavibrio sp.]|nr:MAG: hypothetical protein DHS20C02_18520 [Micavibrio sp.]
MKRMWRKYLTVFVLAGLSGGLLLQTSQSVQQAEDELRRLEIEVENERETIRVLHAEWAHLNRPDRLESLAGQYLELVPPDPSQMLIDPAAQLPNPFVPVMPSVKPSYLMNAQPVSTGSSPPLSVVKPKTKPSKPDESFNDLLDQVQNGGGE